MIRVFVFDMGLKLCIGYPVFNLAWHWHVICVHVHLRSHSKIVCSGGVLLS